MGSSLLYTAIHGMEDRLRELIPVEYSLDTRVRKILLTDDSAAGFVGRGNLDGGGASASGRAEKPLKKLCRAMRPGLLFRLRKDFLTPVETERVGGSTEEDNFFEPRFFRRKLPPRTELMRVFRVLPDVLEKGEVRKVPVTIRNLEELRALPLPVEVWLRLPGDQGGGTADGPGTRAAEENKGGEQIVYVNNPGTTYDSDAEDSLDSEFTDEEVRYRALHLAAISASKACVQLLIEEANEDVNFVGERDGLTPLAAMMVEKAPRFGSVREPTDEEKLETVAYLLQKKADCNLETLEDAQTPLTLALAAGDQIPDAVMRKEWLLIRLRNYFYHRALPELSSTPQQEPQQPPRDGIIDGSVADAGEESGNRDPFKDADALGHVIARIREKYNDTPDGNGNDSEELKYASAADIVRSLHLTKLAEALDLPLDDSRASCSSGTSSRFETVARLVIELLQQQDEAVRRQKQLKLGEKSLVGPQPLSSSTNINHHRMEEQQHLPNEDEVSRQLSSFFDDFPQARSSSHPLFAIVDAVFDHGQYEEEEEPAIPQLSLEFEEGIRGKTEKVLRRLISVLDSAKDNVRIVYKVMEMMMSHDSEDGSGGSGSGSSSSEEEESGENGRSEKEGERLSAETEALLRRRSKSSSKATSKEKNDNQVQDGGDHDVDMTFDDKADPDPREVVRRVSKRLSKRLAGLEEMKREIKSETEALSPRVAAAEVDAELDPIAASLAALGMLELTAAGPTTVGPVGAASNTATTPTAAKPPPEQQPSSSGEEFEEAAKALQPLLRVPDFEKRLPPLSVLRNAEHIKLGRGGPTSHTEKLRYRLVIDPLNQNGETPLFVACRRGFDSVAELLLENHANPNAVDDELQTPLMTAFRAYLPHKDMGDESDKKRSRLVSLLLSSKANVNLHRPLAVAVTTANVSTHSVKLLLEAKADVNYDVGRERELLGTRDQMLRKQWREAVYEEGGSGYDDLSTEMWEEEDYLEEEFDEVDEENLSFLSEDADAAGGGASLAAGGSKASSKSSSSVEISACTTLSSKAADPPTPHSSKAVLPGAGAKEQGELELVEAASSAVDADVPDDPAAPATAAGAARGAARGEDALYMPPFLAAVAEGNYDVAQLLLEYGADFGTKTLRHENVFHLFARGEGGDSTLPWDQKHIDKLDSSEEKSAFLNAENGDGLTPLMIAVQQGRETPVAVLLGLKADPNKFQVLDDGETRPGGGCSSKQVSSPLLMHMKARKTDAVGCCILLLDFKAALYQEVLDVALQKTDAFLVKHLPYLLEQLYYEKNYRKQLLEVQLKKPEDEVKVADPGSKTKTTSPGAEVPPQLQLVRQDEEDHLLRDSSFSCSSGSALVGASTSPYLNSVIFRILHKICFNRSYVSLGLRQEALQLVLRYIPSLKNVPQDAFAVDYEYDASTQDWGKPIVAVGIAKPEPNNPPLYDTSDLVLQILKSPVAGKQETTTSREDQGGEQAVDTHSSASFASTAEACLHETTSLLLEKGAAVNARTLEYAVKQDLVQFCMQVVVTETSPAQLQLTPGMLLHLRKKGKRRDNGGDDKASRRRSANIWCESDACKFLAHFLNSTTRGAKNAKDNYELARHLVATYDASAYMQGSILRDGITFVSAFGYRDEDLTASEADVVTTTWAWVAQNVPGAYVLATPSSSAGALSYGAGGLNAADLFMKRSHFALSSGLFHSGTSYGSSTSYDNVYGGLTHDEDVVHGDLTPTTSTTPPARKNSTSVDPAVVDPQNQELPLAHALRQRASVHVKGESKVDHHRDKNSSKETLLWRNTAGPASPGSGRTWSLHYQTKNPSVFRVSESADQSSRSSGSFRDCVMIVKGGKVMRLIGSAGGEFDRVMTEAEMQDFYCGPGTGSSNSPNKKMKKKSKAGAAAVGGSVVSSSPPKKPSNKAAAGAQTSGSAAKAATHKKSSGFVGTSATILRPAVLAAWNRKYELAHLLAQQQEEEEQGSLFNLSQLLVPILEQERKTAEMFASLETMAGSSLREWRCELRDYAKRIRGHQLSELRNNFNFPNVAGAEPQSAEAFTPSEQSASGSAPRGNRTDRGSRPGGLQVLTSASSPPAAKPSSSSPAGKANKPTNSAKLPVEVFLPCLVAYLCSLKTSRDVGTMRQLRDALLGGTSGEQQGETTGSGSGNIGRRMAQLCIDDPEVKAMKSATASPTAKKPKLPPPSPLSRPREINLSKSSTSSSGQEDAGRAQEKAADVLQQLSPEALEQKMRDDIFAFGRIIDAETPAREAAPEQVVGAVNVKQVQQEQKSTSPLKLPAVKGATSSSTSSAKKAAPSSAGDFFDLAAGEQQLKNRDLFDHVRRLYFGWFLGENLMREVWVRFLQPELIHGAKEFAQRVNLFGTQDLFHPDCEAHVLPVFRKDHYFFFFCLIEHPTQDLFHPDCEAQLWRDSVLPVFRKQHYSVTLVARGHPISTISTAAATLAVVCRNLVVILEHTFDLRRSYHQERQKLKHLERPVRKLFDDWMAVRGAKRVQ
eukprot:g10426.t1